MKEKLQESVDEQTNGTQWKGQRNKKGALEHKTVPVLASARDRKGQKLSTCSQQRITCARIANKQEKFKI